jgi:hypothetical protein
VTTSPLLCFLASLVVLAVAGWTRPDRASCAEHWYVQLRGDRCDGCFECRPVDRGLRDPKGHEADEPARWPDAAVEGRIYCRRAGDEIVVDERTVGCQRGGWEQ